MGYDLHVSRGDRYADGWTPIALAEWERAAAAVPGVRVANDAVRATNPQTGTVIAMAPAARIEFLLDCEWVFGLHGITAGSGTIKGRAFENDVMAGYVFDLAAALDAQVYGDEGERYDDPR